MSTKWKPQETMFTCGCSAFRNCLLTFGIKASEKRLRELMGTTKDGTEDWQISKATKYYDIDYKLNYSISGNVFGRKLLKALKLNHPCVLLVEDTTHWIAVVSYYKRKIKVIDTTLKEKQRKIEKDFTLKDLKAWAFNFDKFQNRSYYQFIELWNHNL